MFPWWMIRGLHFGDCRNGGNGSQHIKQAWWSWIVGLKGKITKKLLPSKIEVPLGVANSRGTATLKHIARLLERLPLSSNPISILAAASPFQTDSGPMGMGQNFRPQDPPKKGHSYSRLTLQTLGNDPRILGPCQTIVATEHWRILKRGFTSWILVNFHMISTHLNTYPYHHREIEHCTFIYTVRWYLDVHRSE